MITAQFGSKKFHVKKDQIYTPNGTSISESIDIEETEVKGKKPKTQIKGIKLQTLSLSIKLNSRFVTVETELRFWKSALLSKKSYDFILGSFKIGRFYVSKYDITDFVINKNGRYTQATLSLSFTEDGNYANSHKINFKSMGSKQVKESSTSKKSKSKFRVGSTVKPKSGTRWYLTALGAINKNGKSGKALTKEYKVTVVYKTNQAAAVGEMGWMRPEDITVVKY